MVGGSTFFRSKKRQKPSISLADFETSDKGSEAIRETVGHLAEKNLPEKSHLRAVQADQFHYWLYLLRSGQGLGL